MGYPHEGEMIDGAKFDKLVRTNYKDKLLSIQGFEKFTVSSPINSTIFFLREQDRQIISVRRCRDEQEWLMSDILSDALLKCSLSPVSEF